MEADAETLSLSLSLSLIYGQAVSTARPAHVTVLMLKNALVNINRPGRQDKFAFMPEEEKTSVSLTQKASAESRSRR